MHITQEELAGLLYESLYKKILPLPDDMLVYPGHGAGSACGKNMMELTVDTLGNQKKINYALKQPNKEAFIKAVSEGLLAPPAYFGMNVAMNKKGYGRFEEILSHGMRGLAAEDFELEAKATGALILDTRSDKDFAKGFIPQSINIGLDGDFAPWVGALIVDVRQAILLITEQGREEEAVTRLSRVGFDNVLGHLKQGFEIWRKAGKAVDLVNRITVAQFASEVKMGESQIIDEKKVSMFPSM
ncbi:rhodanese-like domain-containing protein [Pedobacter sp. MC2016-24]|uniref:rhodanese-like domain-containing protein n=1 Tax=Pedobacter sp. MC2016-24 TaxID=2780090 RepID=UPI001D16502A|nr:MBL fold metallo-hydrolase [Pedobacter sp. MC2016-24]